MLFRSGLPERAVHVPVPVAVIVAVPPGTIAQFTVWSVPALGLSVTIIETESAHPLALVQMKL